SALLSPTMLFILGVAVSLLCYNHLEIITTVGYVASSVGVWQYHKNPTFLWLLQRSGSQLQEREPAEFPVIHADEFTKERFWEVTDNLRKPVVIRGGLADSKAVNEWNGEFFIQNYPDLSVVVRQMIDDSNFRLVNATMQEFW